MNKSNLVDAIMEVAQVPKNVAGKTLEKILDSITEALRKGEDVGLVGFGTFCVRHRKARAGRNPKTGESLHIEASKVVAFKAGKALKDAVQKG
jgi:DNA-binding protein HU-beta